MYTDEFKVTEVFCASKGRKAGEFELPPLTYDGVGYQFCLVPLHSQLVLTNNTHLIEADMSKQRKSRLIRPLAEGSEWWRLAVSREFVVGFLSDYTVCILDRQYRLIRRWGGIGTQGMFREYIYPDRMYLTSTGQLFALFSGRRRLYQYTLEGQLLAHWEGVQSVAFDLGGQLWFVGSASIPRANAVPISERLQKMPNGDWRLFGVDQQRCFFWASDTGLVTQVACTSSVGELLWRVSLNGARGVLKSLRRKSQVDWLEVDADGAVYALGWTYSGLHNTVKVFRIERDVRKAGTD